MEDGIMREPVEPKSSNHIIQLTGNTNGRQYGIICRTNLFGLDSQILVPENKSHKLKNRQFIKN